MRIMSSSAAGFAGFDVDVTAAFTAVATAGSTAADVVFRVAAVAGRFAVALVLRDVIFAILITAFCFFFGNSLSQIVTIYQFGLLFIAL
ncbi:MAG: hypothetical protein AAFQ47_08365 [Pseudomonadota bacterium]